MILRDYQQEIFDDIFNSQSDDLVQLDTGAGKTPLAGELFRQAPHAIFIAHRNVLIMQGSRTIAAFGVIHDTVSSEATRRRCMQSHRTVGKCFVRRGTKNKLVASVGSIVSHYKHGRLTADRNTPWLIIIDEAHHVIPENQWGILREIFPNARFVGMTATPGRMDGASLSKRNGGLFDRLVQCSWLREDSTRKLIDAGMLAGFKLYTPRSCIDNITRSKHVYVAQSVVGSYKKYMQGAQAIVMAPAIKNADEMAAEFIAENISAAAIHSGMSSTEVWRAIDAFSTGRIKVLCNVDMIGEGFDVPAVCGIIISRFVKSFVMYRQWIGRALRSAPGKHFAIIVDLVGVVAEHGEPDESIIWDIDDPPKTPKKLVTHPCKTCGYWYRIGMKTCPECGELNELLAGSSVSSSYVDIKKLDIGLIESARYEIKAEAKEKDAAVTLKIDRFWFDSGLVSSLIMKLQHKLSDVLIANGISIREINRMLNECDLTRKQTFWTQNFKASDVNHMTKETALKAYKKCQK